MSEKTTAPSATTTLTFLFSDLEGSTRLWQQYPQAMKIALARHDDLLRAAIESCCGQVVKTTGDGFHAVFASVQDGLCACIQAQRNLLGESWDETGPLRVRMGLHVGEAQERGGDYYGTTVNRAARLMSAANGGQVLLSAAAADLVADHLPDGISLLDLGEHRLKDLQRPEHIFQMVHPGLPRDFPGIASLNLLPNNLPSQPTVFVGRQEELEEIDNLLVDDKVRLVTLTGPGGTGKTRLALQSCAEIIDHFEHGTYFIDLAPVRDPESVLTVIARTIGLSESGQGALLDLLKSQLQDKTMLLLLDNFEQVIPAAVHVANLLGFCPRLKMLVTSREPLRVRGEHLYPVPPLGLPLGDLRDPAPEALAGYEAIQLFVERAQAVRPDFELADGNAQAVLEICKRLDGLPLAIELAAARVRLFSPQTLLRRLGSRMTALRGGARDLPERQQALRDTIEWSYELLDPHEKKLFEVVSVFAGATFDAVESVIPEIDLGAQNQADVTEGLISLVDKSLLRLSDQDAQPESTGEPRLRMLETIREYAAERLQLDPELHDSVCQAHATYFADFAQDQWGRMTGYARESAMAEMAVEVDNLRIAWRFWVAKKDSGQLHKMVNSLWLLNDSRGWYQATVEITTDLLELLAVSPSSPDQVRQEIMLQTSLARALLVIKGYTPEVEAAYTRALALSEGQGEIPQLFPVLRGLSSYYMYRAEFDKGLQVGDRILELAESTDDDNLRIHGYLVKGANTGFHFGYRGGLEILDKGIAIFERDRGELRPFQLGNIPGIVCYTTSAFFLWWMGFPDQALQRANRAVELVNELNHPFTMAYALFHTGVLHWWRREISIAEKHAKVILDLAEKHGFQIWESLGTMLLGAMQVASGRLEVGLSRVEVGFSHYQNRTSPPVFYPLLIGMRAMVFAQTNRPEEGLKLINDVLKDFDEDRLLREQPPVLFIKVELLVAASSENIPAAVTMFRKILDGTKKLGFRMLALQAATRLCELEMLQGDATESGQILAEIYNGFTEGFEIADLQKARTVLDAWEAGDFKQPTK